MVLLTAEDGRSSFVSTRSAIYGWTDTTSLASRARGAKPKHAARQTNGELSRIKISDSRLIPLRWSVRLVTNGIRRPGDSASLLARILPLLSFFPRFYTRGHHATILKLSSSQRRPRARTAFIACDNVRLFVQASSRLEGCRRGLS